MGTDSYSIVEELDFIINYDIKYRMGRDAGEETEEVDNLFGLRIGIM